MTMTAFTFDEAVMVLVRVEPEAHTMMRPTPIKTRIKEIPIGNGGCHWVTKAAADGVYGS